MDILELIFIVVVLTVVSVFLDLDYTKLLASVALFYGIRANNG